MKNYSGENRVFRYDSTIILDFSPDSQLSASFLGSMAVLSILLWLYFVDQVILEAAGNSDR